MPIIKVFTAANVIASLSLIVAAIALIFSFLSFDRQYEDHTAAKIALTQFQVLGLTKGETDAQGLHMNHSNVRASILMTIFNSGNRAIVVNRVGMFVEKGDYDTLMTVNPTPPCPEANATPLLLGSFIGPKLDPRVVAPGDILSTPIEVPLFTPFDPPTSTVQGKLCFKVEVFNYQGEKTVMQYPAGLLNAAQGAVSPAQATGLFHDPIGTVFGQLHKIF